MKYMLRSAIDAAPDLTIQRTFFAEPADGTGDSAHIEHTAEGVVITDVTIFPGTVTPGRAIRWALRNLTLSAKFRAITLITRLTGRRE